MYHRFLHHLKMRTSYSPPFVTKPSHHWSSLRKRLLLPPPPSSLSPSPSSVLLGPFLTVKGYHQRIPMMNSNKREERTFPKFSKSEYKEIFNTVPGTGRIRKKYRDLISSHIHQVQYFFDDCFLFCPTTGKNMHFHKQKLIDNFPWKSLDIQQWICSHANGCLRQREDQYIDHGSAEDSHLMRAEYLLRDNALNREEGNIRDTVLEDCEIHMELCTGLGQWLNAKALTSNNGKSVVRKWVGVEVKPKRALSSLMRVLIHNVEHNCKVICAELQFLLQYIIPPGCLHSVYMNFPEPFENNKNKVFSDSILVTLAQKIKKNGYFYVATDNYSLMQSYVDSCWEMRELWVNKALSGQKQNVPYFKELEEYNNSELQNTLKLDSLKGGFESSLRKIGKTVYYLKFQRI